MVTPQGTKLSITAAITSSTTTDVTGRVATSMPPTATLRTYRIAHNLDWLSSALRAPITDSATIAEAGTTMSPTATLRTYPIARNQTVYRVPSARVARRRSHRDRAPDITLRAPVTL